MSPDQQAVGIDAIRRAGDQGAEVTALHDLKVGDLGRLHDADLVHLIGEDPSSTRSTKTSPSWSLSRSVKSFALGRPLWPEVAQ